ncbi:hypothetical protein HYT24_00270 [Candidatus Pacearchaeota archaeon]|nr:hypothetical protein [Candidatus Pacearchaeota archaeon]
MNVEFYLEKLFGLDEFKNFVKENEGAYLCSAFFIIDKEGKEDKQHFDFYIPKDKKAYSFQFLEEGAKFTPLEDFKEKAPEKVSITKVDFKEIEGIIMDEMEKNKVKAKIQKIIISLQKINGKNMILGTVFISMFGLLKVNIDLETKKVVDFDKMSFFDMMRVHKKEK